MVEQQEAAAEHKASATSKSKGAGKRNDSHCH